MFYKAIKRALQVGQRVLSRIKIKVNQVHLFEQLWAGQVEVKIS